MRYILIFMLFTIQLFSQADKPNSELLEEKKGFRNIRLGSNIKNYSNFIKIDSSNAVGSDIFFDYKYNFNQGESLKIGRAEILSIKLSVFQEKIYEISIMLEKKPYSKTIDLLWKAYGKPYYDNLNADILKWKVYNWDKNLKTPSVYIELDVRGREKEDICYYLNYSDILIRNLHSDYKYKKAKTKAKSQF